MYKYLESKLTCARVREFNSKPPPELTIEPKIVEPPNTTTKPKTAINLPKMYYRTLAAVDKTGKELKKGGHRTIKMKSLKSFVGWMMHLTITC